MSSIMEIWKVSAKIKGAKLSSNQEELSFNGWQIKKLKLVHRYSSDPFKPE